MSFSSDLLIAGAFASTSVTVSAQTAEGEAFLADLFGEGAVSAEIPASRAGEFSTKAKETGLSVSSLAA